MPALQQLFAALPKDSLEPSLLRSFAYLAGDLAAIALLYALAAHFDSLWLVPLFAFAQGTMFWALFVIGHDCGHGAFSRRRALGDLVGHLLHTPLLVPYHAWRLSHAAHHRHVGHLDRDVVWVPLTRPEVEALSPLTRFLRFRAFLFAFPFYLLRGTPGRGYGSHYDVASGLFPATGHARVALSIRLCTLWLGLLVGLAVWQGPGFVLRHWALPWMVFCVWAALVTYLHHTHPAVPWLRGRAWTPLRGALSTIDRAYGLFEPIHHNAGAHTVHHLFPRVPHYHLRRARAALEPLLGDALRISDEPVWRSVRDAARTCHVVPATGDVARYREFADIRGVAEVAEVAAVAAVAESGAASSPATR